MKNLSKVITIIIAMLVLSSCKVTLFTNYEYRHNYHNPYYNTYDSPFYHQSYSSMRVYRATYRQHFRNNGDSHKK